MKENIYSIVHNNMIVSLNLNRTYQFVKRYLWTYDTWTSKFAVNLIRRIHDEAEKI